MAHRAKGQCGPEEYEWMPGSEAARGTSNNFLIVKGREQSWTESQNIQESVLSSTKRENAHFNHEDALL